MPIDLGNGKSVLSMMLIDMMSGKESILFERKGSQCHFNEDINFENYIITLRVDLGDIQNTAPVLDADIYQNQKGKKGKKLRHGKWHHTITKPDDKDNQKIYDFSFNTLNLRLSAKMSFALSASMDAILVKEAKHEPQA